MHQRPKTTIEAILSYHQQGLYEQTWMHYVGNAICQNQKNAFENNIYKMKTNYHKSHSVIVMVLLQSKGKLVSQEV